ncbi:hypothetical protein ABB37_05896 [Leptomonas pyrrhocoris]|uniref:Uncharacterized protein n=1 Tax=Leptomonas pyrrhocoris TaxID=157538 RepID=A0A0M9FYZ0_LEPPY|nr:hypothetical protein ABB37_05896 [Leptomonas pyrrhocoris]KPA78797.1 hypothetical protein ABB37_05896 [Leptomonas pyrrhocoris]|eukprot:XP_015657236.1 hypothetical protein ABB37_05896 [Leptomonas pyrrhocoris]
MSSYYLFALVIIVVVLVCISCCIGLHVRRRRMMEAVDAEPPHVQSVGQGNSAHYNNNNNGPAFMQGPGQGGNNGNVYYQQQQPPQVGATSWSDPGMYYPTSNPQNNTGNQPGAQPLQATVLYAAPPGSQAPNIDFGHYFPEVRVVNGPGGSGNGVNNSNGGGACEVTSPSDLSPYGEADYVSRPPQPQLSQTQRPTSGVSPLSVPPAPLGEASLPPPQYPALSGQPRGGDNLGKGPV